MRKSSKLLFTGIIAALLLAMAVGSASANRFLPSETLVRIRWAPLTFSAGSNTVACSVTLEASFHYRTLNKVNESLVGHVTGATVNSCAGGSATVLKETLPWHIRYAGFTGTLPGITRIRLRLIGASFRVQPSGLVACLAKTTATEPAIGFVGLNASHQVTGLEAEPNAEIGLEGFLCSFAGSGHFSGTGAVSSGGGATVTVTLI